MERVGFTMRLLPGPGGRISSAARRRLAGDARRAQGGGRPELLDLRSTATDLFAYLEVDDFAAFRASMGASAVNDRWQAEMAALIDPMTDPETGFHQRLDEVFHLD